MVAKESQRSCGTKQRKPAKPKRKLAEAGVEGLAEMAPKISKAGGAHSIIEGGSISNIDPKVPPRIGVVVAMGEGLAPQASAIRPGIAKQSATKPLLKRRYHLRRVAQLNLL